MSVAVVGISIPLFVIGPILQLIFAIKLEMAADSGLDHSTAGSRTLILPAITLCLPYFAYIARLSRGSVLEVLALRLRPDGARQGTQGVASSSRSTCSRARCFPSSPTSGPALSGIITGSVVVEQVFVIPGIGRIFVQAALNRDYTLIMGDVIVYSLILVVANFIVDIVYGLLDPRISYK